MRAPCAARAAATLRERQLRRHLPRGVGGDGGGEPGPRAGLRRRPLDRGGGGPPPRHVRDRLRGLLRLQRHGRQLARARVALPVVPLDPLPRDRARRRPTSAARPSSSRTGRRCSPSRARTARSSRPASTTWCGEAQRHPLPEAARRLGDPGDGARHGVPPDELEGDRRAGASRTASASTWTARASRTRSPSLGVAPKELTWQAGVDVLCFGGTKNGMAVGEAVVFFDRALARGVRLPLQAGRAARLEDALPRRAVGRDAPRRRVAAARAARERDGRPARGVRFARSPPSGSSTRARRTPCSRALPPGAADALRARGWRFYDFIGRRLALHVRLGHDRGRRPCARRGRGGGRRGHAIAVSARLLHVPLVATTRG